MRNAVLVVAVFGALSMVGCKRQVPQDIVQKSIKNAMRQAPLTSSAMCGTDVKGLANATISVKSRKPDNTGVAHVKGFPMGGTVGKTPTSCEGDVEYAYSYTSKTTGYKRKTTSTTWYLDKMKLVAVQTSGVTFKPVEEKANDEDEGG
jgi:hypothetical protein